MPNGSVATVAPTTVTTRVLSVDILRGITIAFMILVNDPGDWAHTYSQLDHAKWNGWTLTDLVFPNFLFMVGASIIFSFTSRLARGERGRELAGHVVRRSLTIFVLAMTLNLIPYFRFTHLRLYGVLPRIALCYLIAGLICLATQRARILLTIVAGLLVGYWLLMRFVPVPGFGAPVRDIPFLDQERNLVAWIDRGVVGFLQRTIHTGVLYEKVRDPEGLLSTIPAVGTTLLGSATGLWLRRTSANRGERAFVTTKSQCAIGLLLAGLVGVISGLVWNIWFPINKNLWTSSYVLFAAGCALLGLAACYWLMDIRRLHETKIGGWLTWPWLVFGSNAIVAYASSVILVKTLLYFKTAELGPNGKPLTLGGWIYAHWFAHGHSTEMTSVAFALCVVAACFIPNWILWRKRIFVKI